MSSVTRNHLLSLPYDVRYLIYQRHFPQGEQMYIQVHDRTIKSILPEQRIPTELFLVCQQLHTEASEYLYNSYLFNIIGTKHDCLTSYERFAETLRKYARNEVRIDAFSNGAHSSTMCISLQAGDSKMATLQRRRRGKPKDIQEMKKDFGEKRDVGFAVHSVQSIGRRLVQHQRVLISICAVVVATLATALGLFP